MDGRKRLSWGSPEWQTAQWQPIVGTPTLVPDPSTVMLSESAAMLFGRLLRFFFNLFFNRRRFRRCRFFLGLLHRLNIAEAQFGQRILYQTLFFHAEIALGLFLDHREHIDDMPRTAQVGLGAVFFFAEVQQSELNLGLGL